jgi:hypothetical protein
MDFVVSLKFSSSANRSLMPIVKKNLGSFFADTEGLSFGTITFTGTDVKPCGDAVKIKHQETLANPGNHKGVPVSVWVEGRQGIRGFLSCGKITMLSQLEELVKNGKPKAAHKTVQKNGKQDISGPVEESGANDTAELSTPVSVDLLEPATTTLSTVEAPQPETTDGGELVDDAKLISFVSERIQARNKASEVVQSLVAKEAQLIAQIQSLQVQLEGFGEELLRVEQERKRAESAVLAIGLSQDMIDKAKIAMSKLMELMGSIGS